MPPRQLLLLFAITCPALAQPPAGQSARLIGVHDLDGAAVDFLVRSSSGCDHGWITHAVAIGHGGSAGGFDASGLSAMGVHVIARLDDDWSRTVPTSAGERDAYAATFASYVSASPAVHVWIAGNEPNVTLGGTPDAYAAPYGDAYLAVRNRVHAVPGHESDVVLLSAPSPWSPCFLDGFARSIERVTGQGGTVDGFAIHAYTGHTSGSQDPALVTSDQTGAVCPGGRYPTSSWQFRVYRDFLRVIADTGHAGRPVYMTEVGHACEPSGDCYSDTDNGYFAALYAEIDTHNRSAATPIRAITPYRWLPFGDGSPRDFTIGSRPRLQADLARGGAHTWTTPSCGTTTGCREDRDCGSGQLCDLTARMCTAAASCASSDCPTGRICRAPDLVCVPASRSQGTGDARIELRPSDPAVGSAVTLAVSATEGYTNIGLRWEGPLGTGLEPAVPASRRPGWMGPRVPWEWDSTVPRAGTYRATFTGDPGASTVYAIAYVQVGPPATRADGGASADAGAIDGGSIVGQPDGGSGGPRPGVTSGCSCHAGARRAPASLYLLWLLLVVSQVVLRNGRRARR
ncbi:MAG: hypothetical protein IT378_26035 [Sandaracinaceae bacterium]|nr:hypothetical protein [Sandaracinaceae bacterium]